MSKYDWDALKTEFFLGNYKSLRAFAGAKNLPYNTYFKKVTRGWSDERKLKRGQNAVKIIEGTLAKEAKREIDRNARQLAVGDLLMTKIQYALTAIQDGDPESLRQLKFAAEALEKTQKSQRIAENAAQKEDNGVLPDILEFLKNGKGPV